MSVWEKVARFCQEVYGSHIDWEERFYICPECGEPVYDIDWNESELHDYICPICEFND